jgi:hypothetical protein
LGYTHYWYRPREIARPTMAQIVADFRTMLPVLSAVGVPLAGGLGDGEPEVTDDDLCFNGPEHCGHPQDHSVVIPWPTDDGSGVGSAADGKAGVWFAGVQLAHRACNGDCSYETFSFPRVLLPKKWQKPEDDGTFFKFCKTAFRPYDLAVCIALLIAKHRIGEGIRVETDGTPANWADARALCHLHLGYGLEVPVGEEVALP